jgi:nicotinamide-nucleotide amidase
MEIETLARAVSHELKRQGLMLVTAESCTGGWVAQMITSVAGSSEWFERGFVAYTNLAKREMLGVKTTILSRYGAVSEQTARAMTGIAGPSGGTPEKPVGTVCFAWAGKKRDTSSIKQVFSGDREGVRRQAVAFALQGVLDFIR